MSSPAATGATPMPAAHLAFPFLTVGLGFHRAGLMRTAIAKAKRVLAGLRRMGIAATWRQELSAALREVWADAKRIRAGLLAKLVQGPPAPVAVADQLRLDILTIQCGERPSRPELEHLHVLEARMAGMTSNRATAAHV